MHLTYDEQMTDPKIFRTLSKQESSLNAECDRNDTI